MKRRLLNSFVVFLSLCTVIFIVFISSLVAQATGTTEKETKYYIGSAVNAGKDTGYSETKAITKDDSHFGWTLGRFFVSGFTRVNIGTDGNPVFLKTKGDNVTLWFNLKQDITKLNGNDKLKISNDTNGFDQYFGVAKTDFGRGTVIVRHTDSQNHNAEPIIYTDYLAANATTGADVEVRLFEEGDYEVALNYEIEKSTVKLFKWTIISKYENYRIYFRFSVRNGNNMVYLFDLETNSELPNKAITVNGFYLNFAKSKYLNVDVKKEILNEGATGLVEDIRFNRPAKDGDKFTEDGIYTITVSNSFTYTPTEKKIYVGNNDVLKAHIITGLDISDISYQISMGAMVSEDGKLVYESESALSDNETIKPHHEKNTLLILAGSLLIVAVAITSGIFYKNKTFNGIFTNKKAKGQDGGNDE